MLTRMLYNQLPVIRDNKALFLIAPQIHILLRQGTQVICNSLALAMYLLGDWYRSLIQIGSLVQINSKTNENIIIPFKTYDQTDVEISQSWIARHERNILGQ